MTHTALKMARDALADLHLNVSEAMRTGGWVPTPLHQSFWQSMVEAADAIAAIDALQSTHPADASKVGAQIDMRGSVPSAEPAADLREKLTDAIAAGLHGTYHCTRVWSAWHVGTMSEDDFSPVDESDTPAELADTVLALIGVAPTAPAPAQPSAEPAALLVRDIANDLKVTPWDACLALRLLGFGEHSVNMAVTNDAARALTKHFGTAPAPAQAEPVAAPFLFIAMDDNKRAHLTWCADESEVHAAVAVAMFWLADGEQLSAEHAEHLKANVEELLDSGALTFEGDPPLYLYRVGGATPPAAAAPDAELLQQKFNEGRQFEHERLAAIHAQKTAAPLAQPLTEARILEMAAEAETPAWGEWYTDEDALFKFARAVEAHKGQP